MGMAISHRESRRQNSNQFNNGDDAFLKYAEIFENQNNLEVFGSEKTKEFKQVNRNRLKSHMPEGGEHQLYTIQ
jgi:hypothetical protein